MTGAGEPVGRESQLMPEEKSQGYGGPILGAGRDILSSVSWSPIWSREAVLRRSNTEGRAM